MAQGFDSWDVIARGAKTHRSIIAHNVPKTGYAGALRVGPHKILLLGPSSSSIPGMQTTVGPFHRDFCFERRGTCCVQMTDVELGLEQARRRSHRRALRATRMTSSRSLSSARQTSASTAHRRGRVSSFSLCLLLQRNDVTHWVSW